MWRSPWVEVAEKHPHPRFEHSCCLIGSTMYLFGGNTSALSHRMPPSKLPASLRSTSTGSQYHPSPYPCSFFPCTVSLHISPLNGTAPGIVSEQVEDYVAGGRYLADVWQLNLETLTWTNVTTAFSQEANGADVEGDGPPTNGAAVFPACAAAVALPHRGRALLLGGHTKAQKNNPSAPLVVRMLDPARRTWGLLPCSGAVPAARGSHVAAIIGDKVRSHDSVAFVHLCPPGNQLRCWLSMPLRSMARVQDEACRKGNDASAGRGIPDIQAAGIMAVLALSSVDVVVSDMSRA